MKEQKNNKRVLSIELSDEVKKVSITGKDGDEKVVMRQELSEDDLDVVSGGDCQDYHGIYVGQVPPWSCRRDE